MNPFFIYQSFVFLLWSLVARAQYAPPAGQIGSLAIHKDSSIFVNWATAAVINPAYQYIENPSLGLVSTGNATSTLGISNGTVFSLGDGGNVVLTFEYPIRNGQGADFTVFENSFNDSFLELAFVEVSSDGVHFVRFPAISNTDTSTQIDGFGAIDATKLYNLAGKYRANYGVPFDLEELKDSANLDLNAITHVRIVDVVGSIDPAYARLDSRGVKINDPFPTPFPSSGFDLDALGVIHQNTSIQVSKKLGNSNPVSFYPNPALNGHPVSINGFLEKGTLISVHDRMGMHVTNLKPEGNRLALPVLAQGLYAFSYQKAGIFYTQWIKIH